MKVASPEAVETPLHVRIMEGVRPPENWEEWVRLVEESVTLDQKLGLLHGAFNVKMGRGAWNDEKRAYKEYTNADRFELFFGFADGWADNYLLKTGGKYSEEPKYFVGRDRNYNDLYRTESEQRQVFARKAFDLLAQNFFKMPSIREDSYIRHDEEARWLENFVFGPLFPVLQHFFRVEEHGYGRRKVRNLSWHSDQRSLSEKHAIVFLLKLPKFLWSWQKDPIIVDDAKPWMVEVLSELKELDLLLPWVRTLNKPCLEKLKEIALDNKLDTYGHPVMEEREVQTIDEACYLGSRAGWLLKRHRLVVAVHDQLTSIRDAERALVEAERNVEKAKQPQK